MMVGCRRCQRAPVRGDVNSITFPALASVDRTTPNHRVGLQRTISSMRAGGGGGSSLLVFSAAGY